MPLLAEEVVQEWLNRQGFFTIRGVKAGNMEIDLLAVRLKQTSGGLEAECRHVEVQVSHNPISYITVKNARRLTDDELKASVEAWIAKKFAGEKQQRIKAALAPGQWSREFVVHRHKHSEEVEWMRRLGITVHAFSDVVEALKQPGTVVPVAGGADIIGLILHLQDSKATTVGTEINIGADSTGSTDD